MFTYPTPHGLSAIKKPLLDVLSVYQHQLLRVGFAIEVFGVDLHFSEQIVGKCGAGFDVERAVFHLVVIGKNITLGGA